MDAGAQVPCYTLGLIFAEDESSRRRRSAQHRVHALCCLLLHVGQDVGVGVHRLPYVGVTEHLLDRAGVHVCLEHECGGGVPQGVEPHVRQTRVPE